MRPAFVHSAAVLGLLIVASLPPSFSLAQTPDDLLAATGGMCRNDLPIYDRIYYRKVCPATCDGYPAALPSGALNKQWLQCMSAKEGCVKQVDEANDKIAKYNDFVDACRAKFRAAENERAKNRGSLQDHPDKQGSADGLPNTPQDGLLQHLRAADDQAARDAIYAKQQEQRDLNQLQQEGERYRQDAQQREAARQKQMDDDLAARRAAEQEQQEIERDYQRQREIERAAERQRSQQTSSGAPANCRWPDRFQACMQGNGACIPQGYPGGASSESELRSCCVRTGCIMGWH